MDWLASVFRYPAEASLSVIMWSTFVLTAALGVVRRQASWAETGLLGALAAWLIFSDVFTLYNGIQSTGAIGGMFLWAYVSIAAFPTAGLAGIVRWAVRVMRAGPAD